MKHLLMMHTRGIYCWKIFYFRKWITSHTWPYLISCLTFQKRGKMQHTKSKNTPVLYGKLVEIGGCGSEQSVKELRPSETNILWPVIWHCRSEKLFFYKNVFLCVLSATCVSFNFVSIVAVISTQFSMILCSENEACIHANSNTKDIFY